MSSFYEDFAAELAAWRTRYEGRPDLELLRLYFVALEREELVTIAYHDDLVNRRIDELELDADVRAIIRQALVWTWKDEEMHAVYIRGELLRHPSARVRMRAVYHNAAGLLAGWATFVQQHVRWSRAPISRALSTSLLWAGLLTGTAPPAVRKHLRYHSFRDFCEFNIDAERTASLCWERLVALGESMHLDPTLLASFAQVKADEDHHRALFEILTSSLDAGDRLAEGVTSRGLAERIGALGACYLPRRLRHAGATPLGAGGRVAVAVGSSVDEKRATLRRALDDAGFFEMLRERAAATSKAVSELSVVIKPAFMLGYHRGDASNITDPALLDELARVLAELGIKTIHVVEAPNVYDRFFRGRGVRAVARYFGIDSPLFSVVDLSEDGVPATFARGMSQRTVSRTWRDADVRVVFGKARSHPVETAHLTLGTLEGLGDRSDGFLFADRSANREVATVTLIDEHPPHFALLDAFEAAPDGCAGMMGCRRPKSPLRVYAGADAIAVDVVAARHLGMSDARRSKVIATACHWFGDPSGAIEVVGVDAPIDGWRPPYRGEWSALASLFAYAVYVLASDRGALFVPSMDERAFPPSRPVSLWVRLVRWALRFAMRLPELPSHAAAPPLALPEAAP